MLREQIYFAGLHRCFSPGGGMDDPLKIIEIILQAGVYGGVPVAAEAMRIADRAVKTYKEP